MGETEKQLQENFCPSCGTPNQTDALFCENCGFDLRVDKIEQEMENQTTAVLSSVPQKRPKWVPILVVEVLILAVGIYIGKNKVDESKSPEQIAENYFVYMVNGEWEKAYEQLDLEESEFINEEMYEKYCLQTPMGIVNNYQVIGTGSEESLYGLDQMAGGGQSALEESVAIDYREKGNTENSRAIIALNQTAEGWKVSPSSFLCHNYQIYVPQGAEVSVDGILLSETYFISQEEGDDQEYSSRQGYQIPYLFQGYHNIKITMEDMEDVDKVIQIGYGDPVYSQDTMHLKPEVWDVLIQKAGENMKQIYQAALEGKSFRTIETMFTGDGEKRQEIKESYEELMANFNEGNVRIEKISFYNIVGTSEPSENAVSLNFDYDIMYTYEDSWSGDVVRKQYEGNAYDGQFRLAKEGEDWVQINFGCPFLY